MPNTHPASWAPGCWGTIQDSFTAFLLCLSLHIGCWQLPVVGHKRDKILVWPSATLLMQYLFKMPNLLYLDASSAESVCFQRESFCFKVQASLKGQKQNSNNSWYLNVAFEIKKAKSFAWPRAHSSEFLKMSELVLSAAFEQDKMQVLTIRVEGNLLSAHFSSMSGRYSEICLSRAIHVWGTVTAQ